LRSGAHCDLKEGRKEGGREGKKREVILKKSRDHHLPGREKEHEEES